MKNRFVCFPVDHSPCCNVSQLDPAQRLTLPGIEARLTDVLGRVGWAGRKTVWAHVLQGLLIGLAPVMLSAEGSAVDS